MKNATMIYKCPGKYKLHGVMLNTNIVPGEDVDDYVKEKGWSKTPIEAHEKFTKKEPTGFLGEEQDYKKRRRRK